MRRGIRGSSGTVGAAMSAWTIQQVTLPTGASAGELSGVSCPAANSCFADGRFFIRPATVETWNGSTWALTTVPLPSGGVNGELNGVSCVPARCTAAGFWNKGNGDSALAEVWNGSTWAVQPTATPIDHKTLNAISCPAARTCTAVGVSNADITVQPVAEHK